MKRQMSALLGIAAAAGILAACAQTDASITTSIKTKLAADETVKAHQIDVTTQNKVVTLTGNVDSDAAKDKALALARATEGVTDVVDMISVKRDVGGGDAPSPERTPGEAIDDVGITAAVKGRLLEDSLVKGLKIDVDTRQGVVYLTGTVGSDAERDQAVRLARETEGVKDVQANLTIEKK